MQQRRAGLNLAGDSATEPIPHPRRQLARHCLSYVYEANFDQGKMKNKWDRKVRQQLLPLYKFSDASVSFHDQLSLFGHQGLVYAWRQL